MSKTAFLFALCLLPALLTGCGGSGGPGTPSMLPSLPIPAVSGQAKVSILWPALPVPQTAAAHGLTPHLIPTASNSIKIAIVDPSNPLGPINAQVLARPTAIATFNNLPVRALTVNVTAYASANGTGTVLAAASGTLTIVVGTTATLTVSLGSVVNSLVTTYNAPDIMASDGPVTLGLAGYDVSGNLIPLTPAQLTWVSSAPAKVTVSSAGVIAYAGAGAANITVTDTESGKNLVIPVLGMSFAVTPATATMSVGDKQLITGAVAGPVDTAVAWSVVGTATSGSVAPDGTYTAPATSGTYAILGISHFDPKRQVSASVTVQSGNGTVTVN